jgi:hypothetical protein
MGVIKSAIIGFFVYRLLIGLGWSCGQVISAAGVVSLIIITGGLVAVARG